MALPKWLHGLLDDDGAQRIKASVAAAEKRTRGEIVPLLVRRSAPEGHVPLLASLILLLPLYSLHLSFTRGLFPWGHGGMTWAWLPLDLVVAGLAGRVLAHFAWVRRLLTSRADRQKSAHHRAELAFHRLGISHTKDSTGILLFMSLEDRQAVVLADKAIAHKLPRETWDEICEMLLRGARQKNLANGYLAAIARSAAALEKSFPPRRKKANQLKNDLVIED